MKRPRLLSGLLSAALILLAAVAWWYLAPAKIGGSTTYVATHGTSMEPTFHTGDLALVRKESTYRVGEVVAYQSEMLHTVVLHRIVARRGNLYAFKGDNNDFVDPALVPRADLIGRLWLHVPHGGILLAAVHTPIGAALLCAVVGLFVVFGVTDTRRRRKRRRKSPPGSGGLGALSMNPVPRRANHLSINYGVVLTTSAVAALVFLALGVIAFIHPAQKASAVTTPYTQRVQFSYSAHARGGPVYPTGRIKTGDPIFLALVHRINVHIDYTFTTPAGHDITGTESVVLRLTGQSGWARNMMLVPATRFRGDHTSTNVTLDLPQLASLLTKVGSLTGMPNDAGYTIAIDPRVHIAGAVGEQPVDARFDPAMNFQLGPAQLVSNGASSTAGAAGGTSSSSSGASQSLSPSESGSVGTPTTAPNTLGLFGASADVTIVRWLALLGLIVSGAIALYAFLRGRAEPFQETVHIQSQYGHMIVPIVAGEDLGWPAVDVANIKALVKLAESGQRLILHSHSNDVDSYMVNEEGTVYRYQVKPSKVVWGEWSEASAPLKQAA